MDPKLNKEDLEKQKLELEIKQLNRTWFQNPAFINILVAIISIIASLFISYNSQFFNIKRSQDELRKQQLQIDIYEFSKEKERIMADVNLYQEIIKNDSSIISEFETLANRFLAKLRDEDSNSDISDLQNFDQQITSIYEIVRRNQEIQENLRLSSISSNE